MILPREKIRGLIREADSIEDIQAWIRMCMPTMDKDRGFITECLSEIYWRKKEQEGKGGAK
jgi:hypothetical protein